MSMFQTVTGATLSKHITAARERVVFVAPGVTEDVSRALVAAHRRVSVTAILDLSEDAYRIGFGDVTGLCHLRKHQSTMRLWQRSGLRLGLLIADDVVIVWSPTPQAVEDEREPGQPNAVVLGAAAADESLADQVGENLKAETTDPAKSETLEEIIRRLQEDPPEPFDLTRKVRVFSSKFQFVETELQGAEWTKRKIRISSLLINSDLSEDLQDILDTQILPYQNKNDVTIDAPHIVRGQIAYNRSGDKILVPTTQRDIEMIWQDLKKRYVFTIPGFGSLIRKQDIADFRKEIGAFKQLLQDWVGKFRRQIERDKDRIICDIVKSIRTRVERSDRKDKFDVTNLNREVRAGFQRMRVIEPRVRIVIKNVSWESSRDNEFTDALRRVLPADDLRGWFDEFTAAQQKR